jgi:hypothetical protein
MRFLSWNGLFGANRVEEACTWVRGERVNGGAVSETAAMTRLSDLPTGMSEELEALVEGAAFHVDEDALIGGLEALQAEGEEEHGGAEGLVMMEAELGAVIDEAGFAGDPGGELEIEALEGDLGGGTLVEEVGGAVGTIGGVARARGEYGGAAGVELRADFGLEAVASDGGDEG